MKILARRSIREILDKQTHHSQFVRNTAKQDIFDEAVHATKEYFLINIYCLCLNPYGTRRKSLYTKMVNYAEEWVYGTHLKTKKK